MASRNCPDFHSRPVLCERMSLSLQRHPSVWGPRGIMSPTHSQMSQRGNVGMIYVRDINKHIYTQSMYRAKVRVQMGPM